MDSGRLLARKFILRVLLFALMLTALHFLYVLQDGSSCSHDGHCFPSHQRSSGIINFDNGISRLSTISDALKPRYNSKTYEEYVQLQLRKRLDPNLRKLWTSREWRRKVDLFSRGFQDLMQVHLLKRGDKALCIVASSGQEVLAMKETGVEDSVGIGPISAPPLVTKADEHKMPFEKDTFDFVFSNSFDYRLFPSAFASEIDRTLKPGGVVVLQFSVKQLAGKHSAADLPRIDRILNLFKNFDSVYMKQADAFSLAWELVLRKQRNLQEPTEHGGDTTRRKCSTTKLKQKIINDAEPLIVEEPLKPWITFRENAKKIKYLPRVSDIKGYNRYIYVDVGARSYRSSIGSWFVKRYPKQHQDFFVYAVEADKSFVGDYAKRENVQLLPYAAWLRNESLVFGANPENRAAEGEIGMGRIQSRSALQDEGIVSTSSSGREFQTVQGFDFAEWLNKTVSMDDFLVLKMDVEGAEFDLLPRMVETGTICLVDELFLECHYNRWQRTSPNRTSKYGRSYGECVSLLMALRRNGVLVHQWW